MAVQELTVMELDAVCGGGRHGGYSKPSINVDVNLVVSKQVQKNYTSVSKSYGVDASNNQIVDIGSIG